LSSADLMPRNLDRRIELLFPVEEENCRKRIMEILKIELEDTVRSHWLRSDGTYHKLDLRGKVKLDSQIELCDLAINAAEIRKQEEDTRLFIPAEPIEE